METAWIADGTRILQAIGWTLIHSLWQAAIVYVLLCALLRAVPGLPARAKYACGVLALGAIVAWCAHTLGRHWPAAGAGVGTGIRATVSAASERNLLRILDEAIPWLMMAYGLGLGLMIGRLLIGFSEIRKLRRSGLEVGGELAENLQRLATRFALKRPVMLRQSPMVAVPMVIGLLRPVILLPPSCIETLSPAALEAVLLHELAHIRRADFLVNILQSVLEAILFFNPCVRLISAMLRREREHCCDDLVVSQSVHPFEYAAVLASLAAGGRQPAFALAARDSRYPLLTRIKRITTMEKKPVRPGTVIIISGIAALMIAVSIACFTPAFAQNKSKTSRSSSRVQPAPPAPPAAPYPTQAPEAPAPPVPPFAGHEDEIAAHAEPVMAMGMDAMDAAFAMMPQIGDSLHTVISEAMNQVDWDQIRRELREASLEIKKIDWAAIRKETRDAMAQASREIDWKEIECSTSRAIAEAEKYGAEARGNAVIARREAGERRAEATEARREALERASEARERAAEAREARQEAIERSQEARERAMEAREDMEETRRELEEARRELAQTRRELEKERSRKH